jgi:hypothetical protein
VAQVSLVGPDGDESIQLGPVRMRILEDGSTTSPTKGWLFALCTGGYERGPPGMTIVWMRRANEDRLNTKER